MNQKLKIASNALEKITHAVSIDSKNHLAWSALEKIRDMPEANCGTCANFDFNGRSCDLILEDMSTWDSDDFCSRHDPKEKTE